ncbi:reverse transcriptase domain-containing protein [Tanacetum coccineum]
MKKLITELPTLTAPKKEEESWSTYQQPTKQSAPFYQWKDMRDKLQSITRYFQGHTIKAITYKPISQILNNREATGRLSKWGIELEAYGIKYAPRSAIKGQVLADFLADTMAEDSSTQVKASGLNDTLTEGKIREEQEAPEYKTTKNLGTETDIWKLYTNGASNKHGSGAGLILIDPEGAEYSYSLRLNFTNSNNDAEYEAMLAGLRIATKIKVEKMHAFIDSKLVASQVEGSYEEKSEKTKKYKEKALEMICSFNNFQISHIPREDNKKDDALRNLSAVQCEGLTNGVLIEELNERSVDTVEVNSIIEEATRTWMTPIQEYIELGILPEDVAEA